ncbi:Integral membrane protein, partial [human gut metagenome]
LPAAAVTVVGAAVFIALSVGQWRSYRVPSWDLAIFSQLAKDYAHLQAPIVPIKGEGFNLLGDHFHPILVLLAPAWGIAPSPLTLLIVQDLLLAVSAW